MAENKVPSTTPDFTTDAAAKLAELFPEIVADGKINLDTLKTILSADVEEGRERFGLTWPGKAQAIRTAQVPTTATLAPDKENSLNWDTTQNVFIEGDNLEVLKVLQKHYYGQIKMIYIDPPYNTGNDFVYTDNFTDSIGNYLEITGQADGGGRLSTNSESAGRFHSNWLNMMYPRLKLARNLLDDDGIIFISIDDSEVANLRLILDEIFGEANFIENYIWESNFRPDNSSRVERENAQHILCYARKKPSLPELVGMQKVTEGLPSLTKNSMKPSTLQFSPDWVEFRLADGTYKAGERSTGYTLEDDLVVHNGRALNDFRLTGRMIWSQDYLEQQAQEGTKIVIKGDGFVPYSKKTSTSDLAPTTLIPREIVGDVLAGNAEIRGIFGSPVFNHPKPTTLLRFLIKSVTAKENKDAIILDFFAGSGTTAHAVMGLNAEDGGNRRCISVQLPEPTGEKSEARKAGYANIAEITRERIRRAGAKILEDEAGKLDGRAENLDVGFRAYKLVDTNFAKWRADSGLSEDEFVGLFAGLAESASDDARPEALLAEVLLKLGFSLSEKVEAIEIAGLSVFSVADGLVVAYLDEHTTPTLEQLRALVAQEPERLVILEDAFKGNDELKTNLVQECRSHNVDLWTA
ncbi:site-specific DNA-methyltransferase [Arcanobacterium canis]